MVWFHSCTGTIYIGVHDSGLCVQWLVSAAPLCWRAAPLTCPRKLHVNVMHTVVLTYLQVHSNHTIYEHTYVCECLHLKKCNDACACECVCKTIDSCCCLSIRIHKYSVKRLHLRNRCHTCMSCAAYWCTPHSARMLYICISVQDTRTYVQVHCMCLCCWLTLQIQTVIASVILPKKTAMCGRQ